MRVVRSSALIACLPLALMSPLLIAGCDRQSPAQSQPGKSQPAAGTSSAPKPAAGTVDRSQRGSTMPLDVFTTPDGKPVTLAAFNGRPLLVNLWATWCAPCIKELPALDRLAADTKADPKKGLHVLTVNQDSSQQATDPVPAFWAKANLPHLERYRDAENNLGFAFGGGQLPMTVLYDARGREMWRFAGDMDWGSAQARALVAEGQ